MKNKDLILYKILELDMDLLGSILGSMEKPPENLERKKAREQKAVLEKLDQQQKIKLQEFRLQIQKLVNDFMKDDTLKSYKFEPMNKTQRSIAHEVADVAGLISFSFGEEEIDRYVMVWKKEYSPSDDELTAYRNNEIWDPEKAARLKSTEMAETPVGRKRKSEPQPVNDYHQKYEHLLSKEVAKDAARQTSANKSYGFVPSDNKRDSRTIEQVLADSREKKVKKQKLDSSCTTESVETAPSSQSLSIASTDDS